jgi:hypothetical protein
MKGVNRMSSVARPQGEVKKWRVIVFVSVGGLLALLALYAGVFNLLLLRGQSGFPSEVHLWHQAQSGAFTTLLLGGSLLALLWRPQNKPLLAQFVLLSLAIISLGFATVSGFGFLPIWLAIGIVLIGIFAAAYPSLRGLVSFSREGAFSLTLLALSLLAAVFLAPIAWRELHYQWAGAIAHDEHALNYHWLTSVLLAVLLVLAGRSWASLRESPTSIWGVWRCCCRTTLEAGASLVGCSECSLASATSQPRWWRPAGAGK